MNKFIKKYKSMPVQVKASLWFLICAFLQRGISCITTPIFTRLLTTTEYGQYSVFDSWFKILLIIVSLNLWGGVYMQGMVKHESERKEYSSALQGLTLTLTVGWTVIYLLFQNFFNKAFSLTTVQMLAMMGMIWATSVFNFWSSEQRLDFKYKKLVIITVLVSIGKPLLGIILVTISEDKVTARILGLLIVEIAMYGGCFFDQMIRGKKFFSAKYWKYVILFAVPLLPHYLSMSVLNSADRIMIKQMDSVATAGIYSLAYSISLIMMMFNQALFQTVEPWIYKKIKSKQIEDIGRVAYSTFMLIAGVNIVLIVFAPEVVWIFAPKAYYDAIWVIPPVAMSVYFTFAYTFFATFEFFYEKKRNIAYASLVGAVLNVVLNYIFIPIFGYYAAGYTTLFCYMLYAIMHYIFMRRICKQFLDNRQPYKTSVLLAITFIFMAIGFGMLFTYKYIYIRYSLLAVMFIALIIFRNKIIVTIKALVSLKKEAKK